MKHRTLHEIISIAAARMEKAGLVFGHGTSDAESEAAFLVMETLHMTEQDIEAALSPEQQKIAEAIIEKRIETRKPASYLLNRAYIQGIPFYVDERVIVPRSFIGEILCQEDGFSRIEDREIHRVLDLCTGSGCLAVLAAHLFPEAQIDAVDLSPDALAVARRNAEESEAGKRISVWEGDLFAPVQGRLYDLILTNPPYVDEQAMRELPPEYRHEPGMALAGGRDGLDIVRRILAQAADFLTPQGGLLCEVGRGKDILETEYDLPFLWLDTAESEGEVFWLTRRQLIGT